MNMACIQRRCAQIIILTVSTLTQDIIVVVFILLVLLLVVLLVVVVAVEMQPIGSVIPVPNDSLQVFCD